MSNSIEAIVPRIVARGLLSLRQKAMFPRLVNSEFGAEAAKRGDVIDVPLSQEITATDVEPSATHPTPPDTAMQSVKVELAHWQKAAFHLTDKEMDQIEANESFVPLQMAEAVSALARAVNQSVIDVMHEGTAMVGRYMSPSFARVSDDNLSLAAHEGLQPVLDARRELNGTFAPKSGRSFVLNYDSEARLLGLTNGLDATKSGDNAFGIEGEIGRRLGFDFYATDNLEKANSELFIGTLVRDVPKNAVELIVSVKSGAPKAGDDIYIEGYGDEPYRLHAVSTSGSNKRLGLSAPVKQAVAAGSYVGDGSGQTTGFAFHRDAVALAMRPLSATGMTNGHNGQMMTITDPESGLSLRLEVSRQYKQTVWEFDLLWGVALVKPSYLVRLQGR